MFTSDMRIYKIIITEIQTLKTWMSLYWLIFQRFSVNLFKSTEVSY